MRSIRCICVESIARSRCIGANNPTVYTQKYRLLHFVSSNSLSTLSDDINDDELTSGPDESDEDDFFRVILDPSSGSTELILVDNVCPVDCNPKLFEMAHGFRALRLAFEENLQHEHDLQRRLGLEIVQMEEDEKMLKIALEREMSNIKELQVCCSLVFSIRTSEWKIRLLCSQVSRHKHLNEIDALVIIRTDQIKHAADVDNLYDIRNAILVDGDTISRLDGRAAEIQQEILQETHNRRFSSSSLVSHFAL